MPEILKQRSEKISLTVDSFNAEILDTFVHPISETRLRDLHSTRGEISTIPVQPVNHKLFKEVLLARGEISTIPVHLLRLRWVRKRISAAKLISTRPLQFIITSSRTLLRIKQPSLTKFSISDLESSSFSGSCDMVSILCLSTVRYPISQMNCANSGVRLSSKVLASRIDIVLRVNSTQKVLFS